MTMIVLEKQPGICEYDMQNRFESYSILDGLWYNISKSFLPNGIGHDFLIIGIFLI